MLAPTCNNDISLGRSFFTSIAVMKYYLCSYKKWDPRDKIPAKATAPETFLCHLVNLVREHDIQPENFPPAFSHTFQPNHRHSQYP